MLTKIPTLSELYDKVTTKEHQEKTKQTDETKTTIAGLVLLVIMLIAYALPYINPSSYTNTRVLILVSRVILVFLMAVVTRTLWANRYAIALRIIGSIGVALSVLLLVSFIWPLSMIHDVHTYKDSAPKINTIYIATDPTCEYCEAANINMRKAVDTYNASHKGTVKIVNISKNTRMAHDITDAIEYKGSMVKFKKHGKEVKVYTLGNEHGPVKPSATYVYKLLKSFN